MLSPLREAYFLLFRFVILSECVLSETDTDRISQIPSFGGKPNTSFIASSPSLGPSALSATNHVKVLPTFQLPSHPNIFAVGDVIDWKEQHQAAKGSGHTAVVVPNVLDMLEGRQPGKKYKGQWEIAIISLGRVCGFIFFAQ